MGIDDQTVKILMDLLSRIETRITSLDEKLTSKLENSLQTMRDELVEVRTTQTRLDAHCEARKAQSEGTCGRLDKLEGDVLSLRTDVRDLQKAEERNEWKIFFKMNGKLAVFITTIGTAIILLYQIYTTMIAKQDNPTLQPGSAVTQPGTP